MDLPDPPLEHQPPWMDDAIPPISVLLLLLVAIFLSGLISSGIIYGLCELRGVSLPELLNGLNEGSPLPDRNFVRTVNLISHLLTFTLPALVLVYFLYRSSWLRFLRLDRRPRGLTAGWGVIFLLTAFPLVQFTYWLNRQIPLPEWVSRMERSASGMIEGLLVMDGPAELLFNLFVVAVAPAIGEELVFRGIVQQKLQRLTRRPILAIWITAVLFSAFHLQFMGFIPRMLLGAMLGYLFWWTGNLWICIIAHFFINALQIIGQYAIGKDLIEAPADEVGAVQWGATLLSLLLVLWIGAFLRRKHTRGSNSGFS